MYNMLLFYNLVDSRSVSSNRVYDYNSFYALRTRYSNIIRDKNRNILKSESYVIKTNGPPNDYYTHM